MQKWKRYLAALLAAVMIATPAMEVYAANGAMTVSGNETSTVEETTEETSSVEEVEESVEESSEDSGEDVVETEESSEETSEEVTTEETTEEVTETVTEEVTTEEVTTEELTTEEVTTEEVTTEEFTVDEVVENAVRGKLPEKFMLLSEEEKNAQMQQWAEEDGFVSNGYRNIDYQVEIPEEVDSDDDSIGAVRASVPIPKAYDARDNGQGTLVKDQNPWGTCWAFSAVATAESQYKQMNNSSEADLSESHLVEFFYNDGSFDYSGLAGDYTKPLTKSKEQQGGNSIFTTWALARWNGVANEAMDSSLKYSAATSNGSISIADSFAFTDAVHLENAYWLSSKNKNDVKRAIMEYGAAGISYYSGLEYSSQYVGDYDGPAVFYNPKYNEWYSDHAVAVVGWDDTFSRYNFINTYDNLDKYYSGKSFSLPKKDGAWLIKNSWGTEYGDDGYFWISYEDKSIQDITIFAFDFANADNYDNNYQYDGSSGAMIMKTNGAAAVYTANMGSNYQTLDAVGVGFASTSNSYTVKIYKNLTNPSKPTSGTLVTTQKGKSSFEGYYTIELDEPVALEKGETFAVVIELAKTGEFCADVSYQNSNWIRFETTENLGETFYKSGSSWKDAAAIDGTMRIKAFTSNASDIIETTTLHDDMVEAIPAQTFTEKAITPAIKVNCNGTELTQGTHYTVTYTDNINVGTATATISAKSGSGYTGTVTKTFEIKKKAITKDMVTVNTVNYTGLSQNPVVVKNGDVVMASNEGSIATADYTIKYNKTPINAGSYTATIAGVNNYSGSVKVTVKIGKTDIKSTTVSLSQTSFDYDGKAKKPTVTVKIGEQTVPASANYTVKYTANTNAGTAKVTLTAKGSLSGKIEKTFTIKAKPITSEGITYSVAKATYSGSELKPAVTVKDGTKKLALNKDYTVTYSQNVSAGENSAKATITGKGNYSGSKVQTFTIAQKSIASKNIKAELALNGNTKNIIVKAGKITFKNSDFEYTIKKGEEDYTNKTLKVGDKYTLVVTLKGNYKGTQTFKNIVCKSDLNTVSVVFNDPNAVYTYTGSAVKPKIVVKDNEGKAIATKNYSIAYSNNVNAGEDTATVTVTGKGVLAGTKTLTFTIQPKEVKDTLIISGVGTKTYNGKAQTQAVKVKDKTKTLKANKDYTVSYANNTNAGTGTVTVKLSDNYTLNGTQAGSKAVTFTIKPAAINKVTAKAALYTGNPVTTTLTVKAGNVTLTPSDYTVVYANNTAVGSNKATVTVTAKNSNFTGSKTAKFSISKESLAKATVTGVTELTYTGKALEHKDANGKCLIVVKNQAGVTIPASNYTVTYKNNTNVGKATVTIKANTDSIYAGSKAVSFKINPAELSSIMAIKDGTLYEKTYTGSKLTYTSKELKNVFTESTTGKVIAASSYKITYKDNINAGTATMVVTGKGNYTGTKEYSFTINKKHISAWTINIKGTADYIDANTPAVPEIRSMKDGKVNMVLGKDYTISCSGATDRGVARITVTGRGNYEGSRSFLYTVK